MYEFLVGCYDGDKFYSEGTRNNLTDWGDWYIHSALAAGIIKQVDNQEVGGSDQPPKE
jgi:hypothetical protein